MLGYADIILHATWLANRKKVCPSDREIKEHIKQHRNVSKVSEHAWKRAYDKVHRQGLVSEGHVTTKGLVHMKERKLVTAKDLEEWSTNAAPSSIRKIQKEYKIGSRYAGFYVIIGRHGCTPCRKAVNLVMGRALPMVYLEHGPSLTADVRRAIPDTHTTVPAIFLPDRTFLGGYNELKQLLDGPVLSPRHRVGYE